MRLGCLLLAVALTPLGAQNISLPPNLQRLAGQAEESVNVTLDGPLLQLAGRLLAGHDPHEATVKKLISGLQGVYVRSFQFASEGEYSAADLDAVRAQFQGTSWSRIVGIKCRIDGDTDVYVKTSADGKLQGVGVVAAEPRELTIVSVVGSLDPADIVCLGGEFGIPKLATSRRHSEERDSR